MLRLVYFIFLFVLVSTTCFCRHNGGVDDRPCGGLENFCGQACKVHFAKYWQYTATNFFPFDSTLFIPCLSSDTTLPLGTKIIIDTTDLNLGGKVYLIVGYLPDWIAKELGLIFHIIDKQPKSLIKRLDFGMEKDDQGLLKLKLYSVLIIKPLIDYKKISKR